MNMCFDEIQIQHIDSSIDKAIDLAAPQQAFYIVLAIHRAGVPAAWRTQCCEWVVQTQHCPQAMVWGYDCSIWDDVLDECYLDLHNYDPPKDEYFMTIWHENDTLEDVIEFAQVSMQLQDEKIGLLIVLHIK